MRDPLTPWGRRMLIPGNREKINARKKARTPEYRAWEGMIRRCESTSHKSYLLYGGRGISVCERWRNSFSCFLSDMGNRPTGHSLERVDVNGNYEPSNCVWATPKTQARNRRCTKFVCYRGEMVKLADLAESAAIAYRKVLKRIHAGMNIERALDPSPHLPPRKESLTRGAKMWSAKLSEPDVLMIRSRAAAGCRLKDIAADFKIAPNTVSMIVSRKKWAHV